MNNNHNDDRYSHNSNSMPEYQSPYNQPFNRQKIDNSPSKSSKGVYIVLICVLICFTVIIILMFTLMRSMIDGGNKKNNNNIAVSQESSTTTQPLNTTTEISTAPVETVTEIVTVVVEVTTSPTIQEPQLNSYSYTINNYNLPLYTYPNYDSNIIKFITDRGNYTIVENSGHWGKLDSGGWINLDDAETYGNINYAGTGYVSTQSDPLTLRYTTSSDSKSLDSIPKNTYLELYYTDFSDWYYTQYNGKCGFVSAKYITMGKIPQVRIGNYYGCGTVATKKDPLNVRSLPSENSSILTTIPKGTSIDLYSTSETGWYYTTYNGKSGYVKSDYISFESVGYDICNPTAYINTQKDPLNLRVSASTDSSIITTIPKGTAVNIIEYGDSWCYIEWNGYKGYANTQFLSFCHSEI